MPRLAGLSQSAAASRADIMAQTKVMSSGMREGSIIPFLMVATTSSMGAGAKGARGASPVGRALSTVSDEGMLPISKIWLQR